MRAYSSHIGDYMRRWIVETRLGTARLHHIQRPDWADDHHDHPWDFLSIVLRGHYVEERTGAEPVHRGPGSVASRRAEDFHTICSVSNGGCWTLVLTGPKRKSWSYLLPTGEIIGWRQYIDDHGWADWSREAPLG